MDPRKATASVSYNGKRIDTKLAEYLQSFSCLLYTSLIKEDEQDGKRDK